MYEADASHTYVARSAAARVPSNALDTRRSVKATMSKTFPRSTTRTRVLPTYTRSYLDRVPRPS